MSILICLLNSLVVKIGSALIIKLIGCVSIVFCLFLHVVKFLGVSLFVLSNFKLILMNIISYLVLQFLDHRPCLPIRISYRKLIWVNILFSGCSMMINTFSIVHFLVLKLFIHWLLHHELLLLLHVHWRDEIGLSFCVTDPFLGAFLFFWKFYQSGLQGELLMSLHFQIVFGNHHVGLSSINA